MPAEMGRKRCSKTSASPGPCLRTPAGLGAEDRDGKAEQDAGHGGVDAGSMHQRPDDDPEGQQNDPGGDGLGAEEARVLLREKCVEAQRNKGQNERYRMQLAGARRRQ